MGREPGVPVSVLRAAVEDAVSRSSSHAVAEAVGMSAPSLRDFVRGSEPRPSTVAKLRRWYVRYLRECDASVDANAVAAALAVMLEAVPVERREDVRRKVLAALRSGWKKPPGWLRDLND